MILQYTRLQTTYLCKTHDERSFQISSLVLLLKFSDYWVSFHKFQAFAASLHQMPSFFEGWFQHWQDACQLKIKKKKKKKKR
jgi:hypothetical protein